MISDEVAKLEKKLEICSSLLGEILATLSLERNQDHKIGEMAFMTRRWQAHFDALDSRKEGAD